MRPKTRDARNENPGKVRHASRILGRMAHSKGRMERG